MRTPPFRAILDTFVCDDTVPLAPINSPEHQVFRQHFSLPANWESFSAVTALTDVVFQWPSASSRTHFRDQPTGARAEASPGWCPANGADCRRRVLDWGADSGYRLFIFVSHKNKKASQIEHWLALPRLPNWLALGLAGYRFCFFGYPLAPPIGLFRRSFSPFVPSRR